MLRPGGPQNSPAVKSGCEMTGKFKSPSKSFPRLCTEPPAEEAWRAQLNPKHTPPPQMPLCTLQGLLSPRRAQAQDSLTCPQNRAASGRAGKAGSQPAAKSPAHSSPRPLSTPQGMFASQEERLRAPSSSGSFQSGAGARCKGTELAASRTLSQQELPAPSGSC